MLAGIVCTELKVKVVVPSPDNTVTSFEVIPFPLTNIPFSIRSLTAVKFNVAELLIATAVIDCFVVEVTCLNTLLSSGSIGSSSITSYTFSLLEPPDFIIYLLLLL